MQEQINWRKTNQYFGVKPLEVMGPLYGFPGK